MPAIRSGLTSEEVAARVARGEVNDCRQYHSATLGSIVVSCTFTYFNAIFAVLSVLLLSVGAWWHLTFLPAVIVNTIIRITQQWQEKKVLDELSLLNENRFTLWRDGKQVSVLARDLVKDDIVQLAPGQQVPADGKIAEGELSISEALLTGDSDEVIKRVGDEVSAASVVVGGEAWVRLTKVGASSSAACLEKQARAISAKPSMMTRSIDRIVIVMGTAIIPFGGMLLLEGKLLSGLSWQQNVIAAVAAVVGMVPEGLYLLAAAALTLASIRLAKRQVLFHDNRSLEMLAHADVVVVDKTGTITTNRLHVKKIITTPSVTPALAEKFLARYLATIRDNSAVMQGLREHWPEGRQFVNSVQLPFTARRKYSQITTNNEVWRLGAPDAACSRAALAEYENVWHEMMAEGLQVIALARAARGEKRLTPVVLVGLQNSLHPHIAAACRALQEQGVVIKVISGDHPRTVASVARRVGIEQAEHFVDVGTLTSDTKLQTSVQRDSVFGRATPADKKRLVEALQAAGQTVAVIGDGVGDILALKSADCGIALGSGSDAARQAAQVVLLDNNLASLPVIIDEGRRVINNITRSGVLFLYKNIFAAGLSLFCILTLYPYPLQPSPMALISFVNVGMPGFLLALETNIKRTDHKFLAFVLSQSFPPAVISFVATILMMMAAKRYQLSPDDLAVAATILLSTVGMVVLIHLCRPLTWWRLLIIAACVISLIVSLTVLPALFALDPLNFTNVCWGLGFAAGATVAMSILNAVINRFSRPG